MAREALELGKRSHEEKINIFDFTRHKTCGKGLRKPARDGIQRECIFLERNGRLRQAHLTDLNLRKIQIVACPWGSVLPFRVLCRFCNSKPLSNTCAAAWARRLSSSYLQKQQLLFIERYCFLLLCLLFACQMTYS